MRRPHSHQRRKLEKPILEKKSFNLFGSNAGVGLIPQLQDSKEVKLVPPADCPGVV
jgi:hypothetical protein